MSSRKLLSPTGANSFRQFLQNEVGTLRQSPVLLVTSEPAADNPSVKPVADASQWVQFTLAQQFGLRTVPCTVSSAFPSLQDLASRKELLRRTGAGSIVAVGSGAAMDMAKALAQEKQESIEQSILVPSTYAATVASGASHSLFLDSVEETLVPLPVGENSDTCVTTVSQLESNYIAPLDASHVLYSTLAVVLDSYLRSSPLPLLEDVTSTLHKLIVEEPDQELTDEVARNLLYQSGSLISYGLGKEDRSTPLALASSLIPTLFPHAHILTFWSAVLPGICKALDGSSSLSPQAKEYVKTLVDGGMVNVPHVKPAEEILQGSAILETAISNVQSNQTVWKSFDVPTATLSKILEYSNIGTG